MGPRLAVSLVALRDKSAPAERSREVASERACQRLETLLETRSRRSSMIELSQPSSCPEWARGIAEGEVMRPPGDE